MNDIAAKVDGFGIGELGQAPEGTYFLDGGIQVMPKPDRSGYYCVECGGAWDNDEYLDQHVVGSLSRCRACTEKLLRETFHTTVEGWLSWKREQRDAGIIYCHYCGQELRAGQECPECR
jgi:hypothetical protein